MSIVKNVDKLSIVNIINIVGNKKLFFFQNGVYCSYSNFNSGELILNIPII